MAAVGSATLWHTPRRSPVRRVLFQVHLWLGVLLGIYTAVIGITGSALVFLPELERAQHPSLFQVSSAGASSVPLQSVLDRVAREFPGQPAEGIDNLSDTHAPLIVYLQGHSVSARMVYADRRTGRILGSRLRYSGLLGFCGNLHIYLLSGMTGYIVNGACACAFLLLCLTGWVLWWPGPHGLRKALRIHWGARRRRLHWDLHVVGGFWTNPLLIAVIATGILFIFPKPVLSVLSWCSTGSTTAARQWLTPPSVPAAAMPLTAAGAELTADAAVAKAERSLGPDYRVQYLALPSAASPLYDAIAYPQGVASYAMPAYVYIDARTGRIAGVRDARSLPRSLQWATYAYAVHFGWFGGLAIKLVWVLLGLLPAFLWGTGLLLWWNRSLRPAAQRPRGS